MEQKRECERIKKKKERDSESRQYSRVPYGIKHWPGVVLDVILSSSNEGEDVNSGPLSVAPTVAASFGLDTDDTHAEYLSDPSSTKDKPIEDLQVTQAATEMFIDTATSCSSSTQSDVSPNSKAAQFLQIIKAKVQESKIEQKFLSCLAPEVQEKVRRSPNIYQAFAEAVKDGQVRTDLSQELNGHFQGLNGHFQELRADIANGKEELKAAITKNAELQETLRAEQQEMKRLQQQLIDRQE